MASNIQSFPKAKGVGGRIEWRHRPGQQSLL